LRGMSVAEMFANSTPEQMAAGMAVWKAWYEGTGGAVVDLGAPFGSVNHVDRRVERSGEDCDYRLQHPSGGVER